MSTPSIYVIAGESSGDLLGGRLMASLHQLRPEGIEFAGIGGPSMQAQGLVSLFPMSDLSVMGLVEVLAHLPNLIGRIDQTVADILRRNPDVVVTIDAPDFSFRVARKVRKRNPAIKLVHYVAPTVWAWRPGRAAKIARFLDHLLALLPFEPPYFEAVGLACTFIGHSAVTERRTGDARRFRSEYGVPDNARIVLLLPGSRRGEITRLLPVCLEVAHRLAKTDNALFFVFPTVPHVEESLREALRQSELAHVVMTDPQTKADAFAAAYAALAASGTVALELALAGVPAVIYYRLNALSAFLVRKLAKVKYVSLPNLVLNDEILPEFIQDQATADLIEPAMANLLQDAQERERQRAAMGKLAEILMPGGIDPSAKAARVVLDVIREAGAD